jgi:hypothetical protein
MDVYGRRLIALSFLGLLVAFGGSALAQEKPEADPNVEEASAHFERGLELYKDGNYQGALTEFRRAYELAPHYQLRNNIGVVLSRMHDYVGAIREYELFLSEGGGEVPAEQRKQISAEIDLLRTRIATLTIDVNVPGAEVYIDGKRVATPVGEATSVNMGTRRIEVTAKGYETASKSVELLGEEVRRVTLELSKKPAPVVGTKVRAERAPKRTGAWIATGVTLTLGVAAGVSGFMALRADSDLDDELARLGPDPDDIDSARDRVERWALAADVFTVLTAVGGGVSIYLWMRDDAGGERATSLRLSAQPGAMVLTGQF